MDALLGPPLVCRCLRASLLSRGPSATGMWCDHPMFSTVASSLTQIPHQESGIESVESLFRWPDSSMQSLKLWVTIFSTLSGKKQTHRCPRRSKGEGSTEEPWQRGCFEGIQFQCVFEVQSLSLWFPEKALYPHRKESFCLTKPLYSCGCNSLQLKVS